MRKTLSSILLIIFIFCLSTSVFAASAKEDLANGNKIIQETLNLVQSGDISKAKNTYEDFNKSWRAFEDGIKNESKDAYGEIEDKMGMVQFLFSQNPVQKDKLITALEYLKNTNQQVIDGKYKSSSDSNSSKNQQNTSVKDLVLLLEQTKKQLNAGDMDSAKKTMNTFSSSWLDVEGIVLTQSKTVYVDAEKDMVSVKAYLSMNPPEVDKALSTIERMHTYLSPLSGSTSYTMVDVITIILREGLEALLVVVALLGFLNKSGNSHKKSWIYGGVAVGFAVSIVLAVLVKVLFTSGTFGNNNFLISGWTGIFAAVMLIYVSYWLHSKSNVDAWKSYVSDKSSKALATGSLFSLGFLAFLAVFREGTEIVLFYIGMASSIKLYDLLIGIALGLLILTVITVLVLKVGLRIPMRPFFQVSSILVFYLAIKFTGMGINGLQLAGLLPATSSELLPTIPWLAVYPTWQGTSAQLIIILSAVIMVIVNKTNSKSS